MFKSNFMPTLLVGTLFLLGLFFVIDDASAGAALNDFHRLNDGAGDVAPAGWTSMGSPDSVDAFRDGIRITNSTGNRYYSRGIDQTRSVCLQAVVSAQSLGGDGQRGAEIWLQIPEGFGHRYVKATFDSHETTPGDPATLQFVVVLRDGNSGDTEIGRITIDWTAVPRFRVRLKREKVNDVDSIILQAEESEIGGEMNWDNPLEKNSTTTTSIVHPATSFVASGGLLSNAGFGNIVSGSYWSNWEYIQLTQGDDLNESLPYWPSQPPEPTLVHDDKGAGYPQGVDLSVDLSGLGYLADDTLTPKLDADGTTYIGETRMNPGLETWDFDGLNANQVVFGRVIATEASGRSMTSSDASVNIISQAPHLTCVGFWAPMDKGPVTVKGNNRALPLKAQLFNAFTGLLLTDTDIAALPMVQVLFDAGTGGAPVDVEDDVLFAGHGTDSVQFVYADDGRWHFNLKTKNHSAAGTYLVKMVSSDGTEYVIDPTCEVSFIVP